jgi:hypothetical protein
MVRRVPSRTHIGSMCTSVLAKMWSEFSPFEYILINSTSLKVFWIRFPQRNTRNEVSVCNVHKLFIWRSLKIWKNIRSYWGVGKGFWSARVCCIVLTYASHLQRFSVIYGSQTSWWCHDRVASSAWIALTAWIGQTWFRFVKVLYDICCGLKMHT